MRTLRNSFVFGLALVGGLSACSGGEDCEHYRPVAVITSDTEVYEINSDFTLSAAESDVSCGRDHTFSWTFQSVPDESQVTDSIWAANNTPAAGSQPLNLDAPGTYVIKMTIFDGVQNSVEDIIVIEVSADNLPPVADAGDDQGVLVGHLAKLDGSESRDPDEPDTGKPIEYRWLLEEAPVGSDRTTGDVYGADAEIAEFVPDYPGRYVFSLEVRDEFVWSSKDFVTVTAPSDNTPPVAEASEFTDPNVELTPCQSQDPIALNGTRSYDPDGAPITFDWGLQSAPDGSSTSNDDFSDTSDPRPLFYSDVPGDYAFELRVHDGELWSPWDVVTVTTQDPSLNSVPEANAGEDQKVEVEVYCRETTSGRKCNPCPNLAFELNGQEFTTDADGDELSYLWVQTSGDPMTLSYPGGPITKAYPGESPIEFGKTTTRTWELTLKAADCGGETEDTIKLTYECKGVE